MIQKYVNLTYIGRGTYSGNDIVFHYKDTNPILIEQANALVANFPDWWEVGDIFEFDKDQKVELKYIGLKPYNGDGGTVNPNKCTTVTEMKARQLLKDFPDWWERVENIDDEEEVEIVNDEIWWRPIIQPETNRISIIVTQGKNIKNFKDLLNKLFVNINKRPKLYELFLILDTDKKEIKSWGPYIDIVDGMIVKTDDWANDVGNIVDYVDTDYLWILNSDTLILDEWDVYIQRMLQIVKKQQAAAIAPLVDSGMEGELSLSWLSTFCSSNVVLEETKNISAHKLNQVYKSALISLKQKEILHNIRDLPVGCMICKSKLFKGINGFEGERKYKGAALALKFQEAGYQCLGYTRLIVRIKPCRECT